MSVTALRLSEPLFTRGTVGTSCVVRQYASTAARKENPSRTEILGPAVRNLVEQYKIEPQNIKASGPKGFILKSDVLRLIKELNLKPVEFSVPLPDTVFSSTTASKKSLVPSGKPGPKNSKGQITYTDISVSSQNLENASRYIRGKTTIPHAYFYTNCTVDDALKLFSQKKGMENVSLTDVIVRAVAASAQKTPSIRRSAEGSRNDHFDLAVQTFEDGKLRQRVLRKASTIGIREISKQGRQGKVAEADGPDQVPYRVVSLIGTKLEQITEILTPSQLWVVSIGDAMQRVDVKTKEVSRIVTLALSYNAGVITEEDAAAFMREVKKLVENPVFVLLGGSVRSVGKEAFDFDEVIDRLSAN
ncbi:hypothetical protein RvY_06585 [Ramazzottius varieornatus]|uniref:Peripheral subunit-binding (PSBD) domain-containing protein n=1 Tax=Ramazzottius varieornatus TaxID=947166 RepID=A0A1D1V7T0_RAMVA|nr:hypothetical protein RvY_06585 [Ramazzottius varieornatus]